MSLHTIIQEAMVKLEEGEFDEAGKLLIKPYIDLKDEMPPDRANIVRHNLAQVYLKKNQPAKAKLLANEIIETDPNHFSALFLLGSIYEGSTLDDDHLTKARGYLSKISSSAPNYKAAQNVITSINKQEDVMKKLTEYENKEPEYFDATRLFKLATVISDLEAIDVCSNRDTLFFRVADVISKVKSASFTKGREEKKSVRELYSSSEFAALDKVMGMYIQKAGFDIE
jgi:tetratricopeptide (TPR) repeat protein